MMKKFLLTILVFSTIACDRQVIVNSLEQTKGNSSIDQAFCSIKNTADGVLMSCPDGSLNYLVTSENEEECEAIQLPLGVLYSCSNSEASIIEHSFDTRVIISEIIDPCGTQSVNDELILVLEDERVFSFRESTSNLYLDEKISGNHITADGSNCHYSVDHSQVSW